MQIKYTLVVLLALGLSFIAHSGDYTPGLVLKASESTLATDLNLPQSQVLRLLGSGSDLSSINPKDSSLWKNSARPLAQTKLNIPTKDFKFKSALNSSPENYRFSAQTGAESNLEVYLGTKTQNYLLRAALLTKLGYIVPRATHMSSIDLSFESEEEKNLFLERCYQQFLPLGISKEDVKMRWISQESSSGLTILDVVVVKKENTLWDLSYGFIDRARAQNYRSINSILLPYSIVDIPESFNLIEGKVGSMVQGEVFIDYSNSHEMIPNLDDIRWMGKKILQLTEDDFSEIVDFAGFPFEPSKLLYHKLIARRNSLINLLKLQGTPLELDLRVSSGEVLKDGKLVFVANQAQVYRDDSKALFFKGYGRKYAFGAFENPLGFNKVLSYLKSTAINTSIQVAVDQLDNYLLPNISNAESVSKAHSKKLIRALIEYLRTGEEQDTSLGTKYVRFLDADVFVSKDISMGPLSGPKSTLFLNETIGLAVNSGFNIFSDKLPKSIGFNGELSVGYNRTFSKFSKIASIENTIKLGFSKDLLRMVKTNFAGVADNWKSLITNQLVKEMNGSLDIGESFVISDNLGFKANSTAGLGAIYVSPSYNSINVRRLYFYKNAEGNIQIYQTSGPIQNIGIDFGVTQGFVPLLSFNLKDTRGKTKTVVYKLKPAVFGIEAFDFLNPSSADGNMDISLITHNFKQSIFGFNFFILQSNSQNTKDSISFENSKGMSKKIDVYRKHTFSNTNPIQFSASLTSSLLMEEGLDIMSVVMDRLSIFRDNVSEKIEVQVENNPEQGLSQFDNLYSSIRLNWSGLRKNQQNLVELIQEINQDAGRQIFAEESVQNTTALVFYDVGVNISLYDRAISKLLSSGIQDFANALNHHPSGFFSSWLQRSQDQRELERHFRMRVLALSQEAQACKEDLIQARNHDCLVRFVTKMKKYLTLKGLMNLVGEGNIFMTGYIDGVHYGDELGLTKSIQGNQSGLTQGKYSDGVINYVIRRESLNYSEFLLTGIIGV